MLNFLIRLALTALIVVWAASPFLDPTAHASLLGEVAGIGVAGTIAIVASFFAMVAFYCRTLQECLTLIRAEHRQASPRSVWYMFAIPFNFVEDFFIVINIANSLTEEKKTNNSLKGVSDVGMVSGIGWSIAQVLSFIPGIVGQIAGGIGMVLVLYHWRLIIRINQLLRDNKK